MRDFRVAIFGLALVACLTGCQTAQMPYLGHWNGGFVAVSGDKKAAPEGYFQLYRMDNRFVMQLENSVQKLDIGGSWTILKKGRIEMKVKTLKISQPESDVMESMGKPYLSPDAIHKAYASPLIFDLSKDGQTLTGLLMKIGPLEGRHVFQHG